MYRIGHIGFLRQHLFSRLQLWALWRAAVGVPISCSLVILRQLITRSKLRQGATPGASGTFGVLCVQGYHGDTT
jgi:hypothetical protein